MAVDIERINNTLGKFAFHLANHNNVMVSVSGGADSNIIVHMIATYLPEYLHKVRFVFMNTGLEYEATHRHLDFMERRYGVTIDRVRPEQNIISAVRQYGVPVLSKDFSAKVEGAQQGREWAFKALANTRRHGSSAGFTRPQQALAAW